MNKERTTLRREGYLHRTVRPGYLPTLQEIASYVAFLSLPLDFTTYSNIYLYQLRVQQINHFQIYLLLFVKLIILTKLYISNMFLFPYYLTYATL